MTPMIKRLTGAGAAALLMLALPVAAQEFSAPQKSEIERIIRDGAFTLDADIGG